MPRSPDCPSGRCTSFSASPSLPGPVPRRPTPASTPSSVAQIDLHMHSTASDGQYAPAEVVRRAAAAGLHTIALTDHDTLGGVREAQAAGAGLAVTVIAGCEFSVAGPGGEMHLLGYFFPPDDPAVEDFLVDQRAKR